MVKRGISILLIAILTISTISFASALSNQNLTYDANGNLITGDGKYREYNEFSQLVRVRAGFNNISRVLEEYIYHPTEDRILAKKVYDFNQTLVETVIYVNDNLVRKINSTGTFDTVYVKDESGTVAEVTNGTKTFYHNDHLGSTSLTTNQSGGIAEETFYDPSGAIIEGGNRSRFDYEGKEFSTGSGGYGEGSSDYDFKFRKYDPGLAIFTQPDALLSNIYDPQELNRYSFERRNPYKYVDQDGKAIGILGAIALVGLAAGTITAGVYLYNTLLTHKREFTYKGLGGYFGAGFIGGAIGAGTGIIGVAAVATGGFTGTFLGLSAAGLGTFAAAANSKILLNAIDKQPLQKGVFESGFKNLITLGIFKYASPSQIGSTQYFAESTIQEILTTITPSQFSSNQINLAQQASGCNPSYQSCTNPPSSGGSSGRGNGRGGVKYVAGGLGIYDESTKECRLSKCANQCC